MTLADLCGGVDDVVGRIGSRVTDCAVAVVTAFVATRDTISSDSNVARRRIRRMFTAISIPPLQGTALAGSHLFLADLSDQRAADYAPDRHRSQRLLSVVQSLSPHPSRARTYAVDGGLSARPSLTASQVH
jgi:hypothetical protein